MSKWKIKLQNIGRRKVSRTVTVKADTLPMAEGRALRECKKHLASRDVWLSHRGDMTYRVNAGFHTVGGVAIFIA